MYLGAALSGVLLGTLIVVDVEDQVVVGAAADAKLERRALLQLTQQLDRFVEAHRESRATLGEALHRDLRGGVDLSGGVLEADQLREVFERADLDFDLSLEEVLGGLLNRTGTVGARLRRVRSAWASVSSWARRPTSTASRSAFIRIRVACPRACAWISPNREETVSSEAMLRSWR